MKKTVQIGGLICLLAVLFRGPVFRLAIGYTEIGSRPAIKITNKDLLQKIKDKAAGKQIDADEVIRIATEITTEELHFTTDQASNDPNVLVKTNKANCVGYSALFNSVANELIREQGLAGRVTAEHKIGKLDLFGMDLHQFFAGSFFKDHDFNLVVSSEREVAVDPSVCDYFWIEEVRLKD